MSHRLRATVGVCATALVLCITAAYGCKSTCSMIPPCGSPGYDPESCSCRPGSAGTAGKPVGAGTGGQAPDTEPDDYACGDAATCDGQTQTCEHVAGGVPPGVDFFSCIALPAACVNDVSCDCLVNALRGRGANQCTGAGRHLTVRIDVP